MTNAEVKWVASTPMMAAVVIAILRVVIIVIVTGDNNMVSQEISYELSLVSCNNCGG